LAEIGGLIGVQDGGRISLDGGRIDVLDGGWIDVMDGGWIYVMDGGLINVMDGGLINVLHGGRINIMDGELINVQDGGRINVLRGGRISLDGGRINVLRGGRISLDGKPIASGAEAEVNLRIVANTALSTSESLKMAKVHDCDTIHCIAGWACILLPGGRELEAKYGWQTAGLALLGAEAASHFFCGDHDGRQFLEKFLPQVKS
jgi:hypothetical protein